MRPAMRSSVSLELFDILGLHRKLQGRSRVRSERADGGGRDPEDLRGFFALQVEEVQEHERGELALR